MSEPLEDLDPKRRLHVETAPHWKGNPRQYQLAAQEVWSRHNDRGVLPWSWIDTSCDLHQCMDPVCMTIHAPIRIDYPRESCVYCGEGCDGFDHLLPKPWTGAGVRHMVAVVPACGNCNNRINDFPSPNVAKRRKKAQLSLERSSKALLLRPIKSKADMLTLGHAMRSVAHANNEKAERVRARLAWPLDPHYDLRAFQKSGIDDPESLGLCDLVSTPLRPEYQEAS